MGKRLVAILGAGNMGTALAAVCSKNSPVVLWSVEPDVVEALNGKHENPRYLPGVKLPGNVSATGDLPAAVASASLIIVSVPSHIVASVGKALARLVKPGQLVVNAAKGVDHKTLLPVAEELVAAMPKRFRANVATMSGPSIANEFGRGLPCAVTVAARSGKTAETVAEHLRTDTFRVVTTTDIHGTALGGTLKNIYALALGMVDGLDLGMNAKASLLTVALGELRLLLKAMGAKEESAMTLSGVGDLVVTGMSEHSRNRRFGAELCVDADCRIKMKDPTQTIEGVKAVVALAPFARKKKLKAPILFAVERVLFKDKDPRDEIMAIFKKL